MKYQNDFDSILGNEQIKEHLNKAVQKGKVSHSYILSGEEGLGKNLFARAFARLLLCEGDHTSSCTCHACKQVLSGNHPDLIYVRKGDKTIVSVDTIREELNETIQVRPYQSNYKIYVVDEAEKMTPQAQNALLKTLEEPPAYAVILLLTTNKTSFLQTILSRSVVLNLKVLSDGEIEEELKSRGLDEDKIGTIVKFARGNLGKALKLASSDDFSQMVADILFLLKNIRRMPADEMIDQVEKICAYNFEVAEVLDFMQMWFRDVLIFKAERDVNLLVFGEEYVAIRDQAAESAFNGINRIIEAIDVARVRLNANVRKEQVLELLLETIKEN